MSTNSIKKGVRIFQLDITHGDDTPDQTFAGSLFSLKEAPESMRELAKHWLDAFSIDITIVTEDAVKYRLRTAN